MQIEKTTKRVELDTLETLGDLWPLYQEWKALSNKASQKKEATFPPDGIIRLEHLQLREKNGKISLFNWKNVKKI